MKWFAPVLVYPAICIELFWAHNAWIALFGFHLGVIASLLIAKSNVPFMVLFKGGNPTWIIIKVLFWGSSGAVLYFLRTYLGIPLEEFQYLLSCLLRFSRISQFEGISDEEG